MLSLAAQRGMQVLPSSVWPATFPHTPKRAHSLRVQAGFGRLTVQHQQLTFRLGPWEFIGVHSLVSECPRETTQPLSRWASVHLPSLQPLLSRPQGGLILVNCTFPGRASRLTKFISCQRQRICRQQRAGLQLIRCNPFLMTSFFTLIIKAVQLPLKNLENVKKYKEGNDPAILQFRNILF